VTADGKPWPPATRFLFVVGDYVSFSFDRYLPSTTLRAGVGFYVHGWTGITTRLLADPASSAYATYGFVDASTGTAAGVPSSTALPGALRITGYDPSDTSIAGTFSVRLADITGDPRHFTLFEGSFRIRPSEQLP
jgi:hypothetical protein